MVQIHEDDKGIFKEVLLDFLEHIGKIEDDDSHFRWRCKVEQYLEGISK